MQVSTAGVTAEIGQRLDTSKSLRAVDVGGATGSLLYSLMQINPNLHGIVYDRPENVRQAQAAAISLDLSERSAAVAGDFFESIPEGDLLLLRFILHDWTDEVGIRYVRPDFLTHLAEEGFHKNQSAAWQRQCGFSAGDVGNTGRYLSVGDGCAVS